MRSLPKILGEERVRSPEFAHSAAIVRRTAEAIPNADGRPLYAGHAELDWPDTPYAQLWHAITLLREYRGDGHIAALVDARAQRHRGADHPYRDGNRLRP